MPEHGLTDEVLAQTDVLIFWSHMRQNEFSDEVAARVCSHVRQGMGLVALHSAHFSKIMKGLLGTSMTLRWKHGESERVFCTAPYHPIAEGIPERFDIPKEEMYGEYFDIPKPDDVIFTGWFSCGEVFRSGCTFHSGYGKIFYFQQATRNIQFIIFRKYKRSLKMQCTGVSKCAKDKSARLRRGKRGDTAMKISVFYEHIEKACEQTKKPLEEVLAACKEKRY